MSKILVASNHVTPWGYSTEIDKRFVGLIGELEVLARDNPKLYRQKVIRRAWLGYGYIALIISGLILTCMCLLLGMIFIRGFAGIAIKLIWIIGLILFFTISALWVKTSPPQGRVITAKEAPHLFAIIKDITKQTKGPKLKRVIITDDFNAAVLQHERLGILGFVDNYLLLGLPMLQALSPEEMRSVIAHEFGHLSNAHGRSSAWVYRIRMTWARLSEQFHAGIGAFLFKKFFSWYGPWFNAYSFVMARSDEYEADRVSAQVTSPQTAASALTRVTIEGARYEHFWQDLSRQIKSSHTPKHLPMAAMKHYFSQDLDDNKKEITMSNALKVKTDIHNTHPCLSDRLNALGMPPASLSPISHCAASELLGGALLSKLQEEFDQEWWTNNSDHWHQNHARAQEAKTRFDYFIQKLHDNKDLSAKEVFDSLTDEEHWEYQNLCEYLEDDERALSHAKSYLKNHPDDIYAKLSVMRVKLDMGDETGLDELSSFFRHEEPLNVRSEAHSYALTYFNDHAPTHPMREKVQASYNDIMNHYNDINTELYKVDEYIHLEAHKLTQEALENILKELKSLKKVSKIWIAGRWLNSDKDTTQLIVFYELKFAQNSQNIYDSVSDSLIEIFRPYDNVFCIGQTNETKWLKKRLNKINNSLIYKA